MGDEFGSSWGEFYTDKYGEMNGQTALNFAFNIIDSHGVESLDGHPERDKVVNAICLMTDADLIDWSNGGKPQNLFKKKVRSFEKRLERARCLRDALRERMNLKNISPKVN